MEKSEEISEFEQNYNAEIEANVKKPANITELNKVLSLTDTTTKTGLVNNINTPIINSPIVIKTYEEEEKKTKNENNLPDSDSPKFLQKKRNNISLENNNSNNTINLNNINKKPKTLLFQTKKYHNRHKDELKKDNKRGINMVNENTINNIVNNTVNSNNDSFIFILEDKNNIYTCLNRIIINDTESLHRNREYLKSQLQYRYPYMDKLKFKRLKDLYRIK